MTRSFTDRVLGGVCGGLGAALSVNPWWLRTLFVTLAFLSGGGFALLYVLLWWLLPFEWVVRLQRGGGAALLLLTLGLTLIISGLWIGRDQGWLTATDGQNLYLPLLCFLAAGVFFIRQIGSSR